MSKRKIKKSGSGATEDLPTCSYFRQLTFLSDSIGNRPTITGPAIPGGAGGAMAPHFFAKQEN